MSVNKQLNMQILDRESILAPLQKLNLLDDFLFDTAMEDLEICKIVLELAMGVKIRNLQGVPKNCDERLKNLHGKIHKLKESVQIGVEYMRREEREWMIREEGREEGGERLGKLVQVMLEDGKYEELKRAVKDREYREELFRKYDL